MPRRRIGVKVLFAELPEELVYRLQALATVNRRSLTGETTVAVEAHLEKRETVQSRELATRLAQEDAEKAGLGRVTTQSENPGTVGKPEPPKPKPSTKRPGRRGKPD